MALEDRMKLAVEFPSVAYREGQAGVVKLAKAIEAIGYDQLDMFDHVVMGYPAEGRARSPYPAQMPILEALTTLAFVAGVTERIGLGTEVLILSQRQPILVAKQVSTIDTLSNGRMRLGVGIGWQAAEYEALGTRFDRRGALIDEAIPLLRSCWRDAEINGVGAHYPMRGIAMEPKPPQGGGLPIWVGGGSDAALQRAGRLGDGWLGTSTIAAERMPAALATIRAAAEAAGRDPAAIGLQMMLDAPPRNGDEGAKRFYQDEVRVAARAAEIRAQGFGWATLNITAIFQSGSRSIDAMIDTLGRLHDRIRMETR
jgi:probable F420-dependent oxidoreductase